MSITNRDEYLDDLIERHPYLNTRQYCERIFNQGYVNGFNHGSMGIPFDPNNFEVYDNREKHIIGGSNKDNRTLRD